MTMLGRLQVRVNDDLVLDAGTCERFAGARASERLIRPPDTTLFHQLMAYLQAKPYPPMHPSGSIVGAEGIAAAALVLRWGSYLAVLLDHEKPIWPQVRSVVASRISDEEMARINIEASAALAEWIDLCRADLGGRRYEELVNKAVSYLWMPRNSSRPKGGEFAALADPEIATLVLQASDAERLERVRAEADRFPTRIFANALVNFAWRNGPVENIHAGQFRGYPLDQRRVTLAEERKLVAFASERLALGTGVCVQFARERPRRSWSEQILPYGLAERMLITPSAWTLTESTRAVRLQVRT